MSELKAIRAVCDENGLILHLDGARLYNAIIAKTEDPKEYGKVFHSISLCLSKGLGAPVGSLLVGDKATIKKARRLRKVFGGGMRQAGFLAAAGIYALENHVERLRDDHKAAQRLAGALRNSKIAGEVLPVETNIVIFEAAPPYTPKTLVEKFKEHGIYGYAISPTQVRLVTHLDITPEMIEKTIKVFSSL
jgi:threonine aldolase